MLGRWIQLTLLNRKKITEKRVPASMRFRMKSINLICENKDRRTASMKLDEKLRNYWQKISGRSLYTIDNIF